jgi:tyrosyl-tRNA synthetase
MSLSQDLQWRGLIKDKTFADVAWLDKPHKFYLGIDASSDSMQVGNLAVLILARRLIDADWEAVLLAGGATSLIGDPKENEERQLKSAEEVAKNIDAVKTQISKLFNGQKFQLVNNYDWFKDITYLDFLRDVGKHFSMTELMQREFISERMREDGVGISYAEFSYSLIQGYDYWQINKNYDVTLQIGGSDQWGNMLSGVSLVRKKEGKEVQAFSMPLVIDKSTGKKFGKSEAGAIWLDAAQTTPTQFHQFWINSSDADIEDYLKYYSLKSRKEIEELIEKQKADPSSRVAQKALAEELTNMIHGGDNSDQSQLVTQYLTGQISLADASEKDLKEIRNQIPSVGAQINDLHLRKTLVDTGLATSRTDALRLINDGAIYVNGERQPSDGSRDLFVKGPNIIRRGKAYKDSALVELE